MDSNGKLKLNCRDICNWKNPAVTVTILVLIDVAYLIFKSLGRSLISSVAHKIFFMTLIYIVKQQVFGKRTECSCFSKEKIENNYSTLYDNVNKGLDKLRRIILLQEIPSLVRLLVTLAFVLVFGSYFSALSLIILAMNFWVIYNYGTVRDRVRQYSTVAIELTSKIISDNIPKFKESQ